MQESEPRSPNVSPKLRWYPVVTFLQLFADMFARQEPRGFGHNYASEHYMAAWLALTEPAGWTEEDSQRLRMHLRQGPRQRLSRVETVLTIARTVR